MNVLFRPGHFGHVDQPFDARLELHECTVVRDVGDASLETCPHGIFALDALPGVVEELLHAKGNAVGFMIDLDDLHLHLLADVEHLGRMIDAAPRYVGDMQQAVDASEIHKRAVVGDVLNHADDDLAFLEILHQLLTLFGASLLEHGTAGNDDVATTAIHLQDLERLRCIHERSDVANGPDVHLRSRQKSHGTIEIDGEAALHLVKDDALHFLAAVECLLQLAPAFLAPRLVAGEHGLTERILHPLKIDFDLVADLEVGLPSGPAEFAQRHASLGL